MTQATDIVVIGAGQAGLAVSRCLAEAGIDHVVLERGRIAERWRSERWASLRLLTPNWMTRLPGFRYAGPDPDAFMRAVELADLLAAYASCSRAPVVEDAGVLSVSHRHGRFAVRSTRGAWTARGVVIATGACDQPAVPSLAKSLPAAVTHILPPLYRSARDLPAGGVLVVGASATGVQLAEEISASGRPVTLSVGRHTRLPRLYRGRDIMDWLDRTGILDELPPRGSAHPAASHTSLQLIGSPEPRDIDLGTLERAGVRLTGRLVGAEGYRLRFADDLRAEAVRADVRLRRVLDRIDAHIAIRGEGPAAPAGAIAPLLPGPGPADLDLRTESIRTVVWATGFRRSYPWLQLPVLDAFGDIRHVAGLTPFAGLYVIGMPLQTCRRSTFVDGVGKDAAAIARHIRLFLLERRPWGCNAAEHVPA